MHCARLGYQCIELLTTRALTLPIAGPEVDWLRAVRRGDVAFDEWWARCLELDDRLAGLAVDERLPSGPDRRRVEAWCVDAHIRHWRQAGAVAV
jgi:hypothetical protein